MRQKTHDFIGIRRLDLWVSTTFLIIAIILSAQTHLESQKVQTENQLLREALRRCDGN